jgi:hypothetical protein
LGLTARKSLGLEDAGLDGLFAKKRSLWLETAQQAYDYTAEFVKEADEPVRPDDLIDVLIPVLEVTKVLRDFLSEHKLRQKYWYVWFGELIIDRLWDEISDDEEDDDENDENDEEDDE